MESFEFTNPHGGGHCVASPGNDPNFEKYLDQAIGG